MANYTALKAAIADAIKTNGQEYITGQVLQEILLSLVETLGESAVNGVDGVQDDLAAEVTARQNADVTLDGKITTEKEAREAADITLQGNIDAEATDRQNADSTLQGNIDAEATARGDADTTLQGNIDAEATARENADTTLQGDIDAEVTARQNADTTLQGNIDTEVTARQNADTALQNAVNAINTKLSEGYVYAGIATTETEPDTPTGKVFYIATGAGTYTDFGGLVLTQGINIIKNNGSTWSFEQVCGIDDEPTEDSQGLAKSGGILGWGERMYGRYEDNSEYVDVIVDAERRLLFGIRKDSVIVGNFDGIPQLQQAVSLLEGENASLSEKVAFLESVIHSSESVEWISVELDKNKRLLSGRKSDGTKVENLPVSIMGTKVATKKIPDGMLEVTLDRQGRLISYRDKEGSLHEDKIYARQIEAGNLQDEKGVLPDYYYENDYIYNIALRIQECILQMGRGDVFGFITDSHPSNLPQTVMSGRIYKYLASQIPLQKVVFGGDIGPGTADMYGDGVKALQGLSMSLMQQTERLYAPCREAGISVYNVRGNHDHACIDTTPGGPGYSVSRLATKQMTFAYADMSTLVYNDAHPDSNYYYFDNKVQAIRYIVVDTSDSPNRVDQQHMSSNVNMMISDTQIRWIVEEAIMNVPDNYKIIFLGHVCPSAIGYGYPIEPGNNPPYQRPSIYNVNRIIEAIQNNTVAELILEDSSTIEYDFTNYVPKVIAYIAGHQHFDSETIENGCLYYCSSADTFAQSHRHSTVEIQLLNINLPRRYGNSITEDLLNIIIPDITNNTVYLYRIGVGLDKIFHTDKHTVSAGNTITLTSKLSGTLVWKSYDAKILKDGATNDDFFSHTIASVNVSTGVVNGLVAGESVVLAYSEDDNAIEFFYIVVE